MGHDESEFLVLRNRVIEQTQDGHDFQPRNRRSDNSLPPKEEKKEVNVHRLTRVNHDLGSLSLRMVLRV